MKTLLAVAVLLSACSNSVGPADPPDLGSVDLAPALPTGIYPLAGYDPTLPDDDLAPLGALIGDRGVVGIGESIHTSGGYQMSRARLIQYLVDKKGFRLVAIEWQRTSGEMVEGYIVSGQGTATQAAEQLSVWSSQEVRSLLVWLKTFNDSHPDDLVHFTGFDVQQPDTDSTTLKTFLTAAAGKDGPALVSPLAKCDIGAGQTDTSVQYVGDYSACSAGLDAIDSYMTKNQSALLLASSTDQYQGAELASTGLRAWQGEIYYYNSDVKRSFEARDDAMADVYLAIKKQRYPALKAIVWAHNYHLRMLGAQVMGQGAVGAPTMGTSLAATLGDDYFPVGQIGWDVGIDWPGVGCGSQPTPDPESMEGLLSQLPVDDVLVDLSFTGAQTPFFTAGKSYLESDYESMIPLQQYRALVFLKRSPKMTPLDWPSCR
jgi:erythromycin esterase